MNKIKNIAIIGYGNIAKKHLKILLKLTPNSKFFIISKRNFEDPERLLRRYCDMHPDNYKPYFYMKMEFVDLRLQIYDQ